MSGDEGKKSNTTVKRQAAGRLELRTSFKISSRKGSRGVILAEGHSEMRGKSSLPRSYNLQTLPQDNSLVVDAPVCRTLPAPTLCRINLGLSKAAYGGTQSCRPRASE